MIIDFFIILYRLIKKGLTYIKELSKKAFSYIKELSKRIFLYMKRSSKRTFICFINICKRGIITAILIKLFDCVYYFGKKVKEGDDNISPNKYILYVVLQFIITIGIILLLPKLYIYIFIIVSINYLLYSTSKFNNIKLLELFFGLSNFIKLSVVKDKKYHKLSLLELYDNNNVLMPTFAITIVINLFMYAVPLLKNINELSAKIVTELFKYDIHFTSDGVSKYLLYSFVVLFPIMNTIMFNSRIKELGKNDTK